MIQCGVLFMTVVFVTAVATQKLHPLSDEYIQEINSKQSTWKAGRNFEIEEYERVKVLANGIKSSEISEANEMIHNEDEDVPEFFDAREGWPECADIIGLIRDQSKCSSSWALGPVGVMSDRICIHSNATRKLLVSGQDLLSCSSSNLGTCDGGYPYATWEFWRTAGIVTGGLYNHTEQGCKSYTKPPCDDHPIKCTENGFTPLCWTKCDDTTLDYESQRTYGTQYYVVSKEKQIQLEILKNGPVAIMLTLYTDFVNYKSGIYQRTVDREFGGIAAKILGWGVENDVKYWTIANAWNERWGENGYFRIIRGRDEGGVEYHAAGVYPDFNKF